MPKPFKRRFVRIAAMALLPIMLLLGQQRVTADDTTDKLERTRAEVARFLTTTDYQALVTLVERWKQDYPLAERKPILLLLLKRLSDPREIGLTNCESIAIASRVRAGKMKFQQGLHFLLYQDLFLENGRCAWAVQQLLVCKLPHFTEEVGKDQTLLNRSVREAYLEVIDAMAMPPPKPAPPPLPALESEIRKQERESMKRVHWKEKLGQEKVGKPKD